MQPTLPLLEKIPPWDLSEIPHSIEKSTSGDKKYKLTFNKNIDEHPRFKKGVYTVHFGHKDYEDFLMHKDPERRRLYRARHNKERNQAVNTPGWLSYHILW